VRFWRFRRADRLDRGNIHGHELLHGGESTPSQSV
jgi:hypothetical protein